MQCCLGSDWNEANFPHNSQYVVVFWVLQNRRRAWVGLVFAGKPANSNSSEQYSCHGQEHLPLDQAAHLCEAVLVTHQCFDFCWIVLSLCQRFLIILLCPLQLAAWVGQETELGQCQDSYPELAKGIFHARSHFDQQRTVQSCWFLKTAWALFCSWDVVDGCLCTTLFHLLHLLNCFHLALWVCFSTSYSSRFPLGLWVGERPAVVWVGQLWDSTDHHNCWSTLACSAKAGRNVSTWDACVT